jgi:hypothetical protein
VKFYEGADTWQAGPDTFDTMKEEPILEEETEIISADI